MQQKLLELKTKRDRLYLMLHMPDADIELSQVIRQIAELEAIARFPCDDEHREKKVKNFLTLNDQKWI